MVKVFFFVPPKTINNTHKIFNIKNNNNTLDTPNLKKKNLIYLKHMFKIKTMAKMCLSICAEHYRHHGGKSLKFMLLYIHII